MSTSDGLWADYQEHHRAGGNRYCHLIGIPLIVVGLLGLLAIPVFHIGTWPVEVALLLVLITGVGDVWLEVKLGAATLVVEFLLYLAARHLGWKPALGLFVLGWALQFVGHGVYEKRRPAFARNVAHLLVGPMWVLNHFVRLHGEAATAARSLP